MNLIMWVDEKYGTFAGLTVMFIMLGGVVALFMLGIVHVAAPAKIEKFERLRSDYHATSSQAEDVLGQVTEANVELAGRRAYNQYPAPIEWFVPDEWDDVEYIEVKE